MKDIRNIWTKFVHIGVDSKTQAEEVVQLKIINTQAGYCIIFIFAFLVKSIFQGYSDIVEILSVLFIFIIVLLLNYFKQLFFVKIYWIGLLSIIVFSLILLYGSKPHGEILFIIPLINVFIFYKKPEIRTLLIFIIIALAITSLLSFLFYSSPLADSTDSTDSVANFILTVLCIGAVGNIYTKALRKQLTFVEKSNQALKGANADLEHFTYMASHNLKTPLRTILGNVFLMHKRLDKAQLTPIQEYTDEIKKGANDMHHLINDIMEYAIFIKDEMIDVNAINFFDLSQTILQSVNISLNKSAILHYEGEESIITNETLIKSIIQNLIENGIKYNDAEQPEIRISLTKHQGNYLIEVSDNGIGISEAYYDKIFVMFKRLHHGEKYEGTGIGLATCRRLLNKYNGEIWLKSKVGEGTTFYVNIPISN